MSKVFNLVDDDSIIFRKKIEEINTYLDSLKQITDLLSDKMDNIYDCDCFTEMLDETQRLKFENIKNCLDNIKLTI